MHPGDGESLDERLSSALDAMSNPLRLALLRQLRSPKTLTQILLRAEDASTNAERLLARQTVKVHLDRLVASGLVVPSETQRLGRPTLEYTINHGMIYAYAEELRELAKLRPTVEPDVATMGQDAVDASASHRGSALVMVKGVEEERTFPLHPGVDRWVVGRAASCGICLHFDPYASAENAVVARRGDAFTVMDLPGSRNGTRLNFRRLTPGVAMPLANGDLVSVGRSSLLFRS